ncbi:MAG TPA: diacylglycerol kinase family protein [Thermoanaerobaculia bacterium]|nr:diacylglycerol kinase family protein [Thermoanaerobaculia bacterium]
MKTCVILNPRAGSAQTILESLRRALDRLDELEIRETDAAGGARALAARAVEEGFDRLVAAGGDGTLNEVLNGLAPDFDRAELGLVPAGTGNDLARTLGIPLDPERAVEVVASGAVRKLDVARLHAGGEDRWFLNVSAGGFSGEVDEGLKAEFKESWGPLSYLRTAFEAATELETYDARLTFEPGTSDEESLRLDAVNVVVANGRYVGGGLHVAPTAAPDDGLLDVVVIHAAPIARLSLLAPRVAIGAHLGHELVEHRRARSLEVRSDPPMPFNADGEPIGSTPVRYQVLPKAVRFLAPPEEL